MTDILVMSVFKFWRSDLQVQRKVLEWSRTTSAHIARAASWVRLPPLAVISMLVNGRSLPAVSAWHTALIGDRLVSDCLPRFGPTGLRRQPAIPRQAVQFFFVHFDAPCVSCARNCSGFSPAPRRSSSMKKRDGAFGVVFPCSQRLTVAWFRPMRSARSFCERPSASRAVLMCSVIGWL